MSTLSLEEWFPIPIWYTRLEEITDAEEAEAIAYCKNKQDNLSGGRKLSNVGGWQSEDLYLNEIESTPLSKYFMLIKPLLAQCLKDLDSSLQTLIIDNIWININGKEHYNIPHTHGESILSGVFYLSKNNSNINFIRNIDISTYFLENVRSKNNTPVSFRHLKYLPLNKTLYIFPGWLIHSVEENKQLNERISISFNVIKEYDKI
jgi:uncharacterized protein (TIGR02466 family)